LVTVLCLRRFKREGPTMQIGGALGSIVGRYLKVSPRERRILLVAGTAAGMAAVFRTPLGAALLAVGPTQAPTTENHRSVILREAALSCLSDGALNSPCDERYRSPTRW
jgi:hypothetical protein